MKKIGWYFAIVVMIIMLCIVGFIITHIATPLDWYWYLFLILFSMLPIVAIFYSIFNILEKEKVCIIIKDIYNCIFSLLWLSLLFVFMNIKVDNTEKNILIIFLIPFFIVFVYLVYKNIKDIISDIKILKK